MANVELVNSELESVNAAKKARNPEQELQSMPKMVWKRFSNSSSVTISVPQPRCLLAALLSLQIIVLVIVRGFPSSLQRSRSPEITPPAAVSRSNLYFPEAGLNLDSVEQKTVKNELKLVQNEQESVQNEQKRVENEHESVENDQKGVDSDQKAGNDQQKRVANEQKTMPNEDKPVEIKHKSVEIEQKRVENKQKPVENEQRKVENAQKTLDNEQNGIRNVHKLVKNGHNSEIAEETGLASDIEEQLVDSVGNKQGTTKTASETFSDGVNPDLVMPSGDNSSNLALRTADESSPPSEIARNTNEICDLGRVFVYELPSIFNSELLENCRTLSPWFSLCPAVENSGLGQPVSNARFPVELDGAWYSTDQFSGEIIFHKRMLEHPCRTDRPELATAFYVPFYAGLAVGQYLWSNYTAADRDRHCRLLLDWLIEQKYWRRNFGLDHFLMLGRITWDFRRSKDEDWGSSFLYMPGIQNTTRLLIERNPWDENEMGVPYPTAFHPRNREDVFRWQEYLRNVKRNTFFSFAGAARKSIPNDFRGILLDQCKESENCRSLNCSGIRCSNDSMAALELFLDSSFCLQPRGDSFTRRSIFDCLIAGSIPVFFWNRTAYWQYKWHLPSDVSSYSVFISKLDVRNGARIEDVLKAIDAKKVQSLRETVINSLPRFIYASPGHHMENMQDAFDVAVDGVLKRINSFSLNSRLGV